MRKGCLDCGDGIFLFILFGRLAQLDLNDLDLDLLPCALQKTPIHTVHALINMFRFMHKKKGKGMSNVLMVHDLIKVSHSLRWAIKHDTGTNHHYSALSKNIQVVSFLNHAIMIMKTLNPNMDAALKH